MVGKTPGNLRDFRIDEASGNGRGGSDLSAQPESTPRQNVAPRARMQATPTKSSVSEWAGPVGESLTLEDLWPEWNDEVGVEVDLGRPVVAPAKAAPQNQASPARQAAHASVSKSPAPSPAASASTLPQASEATSTGVDAWAVDLALAERRMERSGEVDFSNQFQKHELLKRKTVDFVRGLHEAFRAQIELFNEARYSAGHAVHMYRVSGTETDFMLYRNGVKLVVSGSKSGKVVFAFNQYMGQIFTAAQATPTVEIEGHWGPFDQLQWVYKGERIRREDVVQYFMTEFVRQSFK